MRTLALFPRLESPGRSALLARVAGSLLASLILASVLRADPCADIPAGDLDPKGGDCRPLDFDKGPRFGRDYAADPSYRCVVDARPAHEPRIITGLYVIFDDREVNCTCNSAPKTFTYRRKLVDASTWSLSYQFELGGAITVGLTESVNIGLAALEAAVSCAAHLEITRESVRGGSSTKEEEFSETIQTTLLPCSVSAYLKVVTRKDGSRRYDFLRSWEAQEPCYRGGGTVVAVVVRGEHECESCGIITANGTEPYLGLYNGRRLGVHQRTVYCDECEEKDECVADSTGRSECPYGERCDK
jgi:hypothetical protein